MVDALIPPAAVNYSTRGLPGGSDRSRLLFEGITKTGVPDTWENTIDIAETMITSWKEGERRRSLCGELKR